MAVELVEPGRGEALAVQIVTRPSIKEAGLAPDIVRWAGANRFEGKAGQFLLVPGADGAPAGALFGMAEDGNGFDGLATGALARKLPEGKWRFKEGLENADLAVLGLVLGGYGFTRYGKKTGTSIAFEIPEGVDAARIERIRLGVFLTRDLINIPANDMGPEELEKAVRELARSHKARVTVTKGDKLLTGNLPLIHTVGRASSQAPRLIDMSWGPKSAPKVTLVGKGVCFDTGGLNIKPSGGMALMKKDMGGAANVLGLAAMIMAAGLKLRLRVLIPAVENSISAGAFRPGDILTSRTGRTVEIGNTDAEGRLVLADALALGDEEKPELLIDMATLTGAARVAVGPDIAPFYTADNALAGDLIKASQAEADPAWRMPLWQGYSARLDSKIADTNNVTRDGFAGSITAALFLQAFVKQAKAWAHFDIYGWNPVEKPHCPVGGEAQGIRALERVLAERYGK